MCTMCAGARAYVCIYVCVCVLYKCSYKCRFRVEENTTLDSPYDSSFPVPFAPHRVPALYFYGMFYLIKSAGRSLKPGTIRKHVSYRKPTVFRDRRYIYGAYNVLFCIPSDMSVERGRDVFRAEMYPSKIYISRNPHDFDTTYLSMLMEIQRISSNCFRIDSERQIDSTGQNVPLNS